MKGLRWAIVGVGQMAYHMAAALKHHSKVELYAVYSRSAARAQQFAKDFGITKTYTDFAELLADECIDILYLATPNHTHSTLCIQGVGARKHVLCEKPLGISADEVRQIALAQDHSQCVVIEGMWTKYLPIFTQICDHLRQDIIGSPVAYEASLGHRIAFDEKSRFYDKLQGGGALLDLGVYPLSLVQWLFGDINHVTSMLKLAPTKVDAEAFLTTRHANGMIGDIKVSLERELRNDFIIYGTKGRIEIQAPLYRPRRYRIIPYVKSAGGAVGPSGAMRLKERIAFNQTLFSVKETFRELRCLLTNVKWQKISYRGNGYGHQVDAFLNTIENSHTMVKTMTLNDTLKVLEIIDRCKSQET